MPGPTPRAPRQRRAVPLREIGFRLLNRLPFSHMATGANPQAGVQWASCNPAFKKPETAVETIEETTPAFIFISSVSVIQLPAFTPFSSPCD